MTPKEQDDGQQADEYQGVEDPEFLEWLDRHNRKLDAQAEELASPPQRRDSQGTGQVLVEQVAERLEAAGYRLPIHDPEPTQKAWKRIYWKHFRSGAGRIVPYVDPSQGAKQHISTQAVLNDLEKAVRAALSALVTNSEWLDENAVFIRDVPDDDEDGLDAFSEAWCDGRIAYPLPWLIGALDFASKSINYAVGPVERALRFVPESSPSVMPSELPGPLAEAVRCAREADWLSRAQIATDWGFVPASWSLLKPGHLQRLARSLRGLGEQPSRPDRIAPKPTDQVSRSGVDALARMSTACTIADIEVRWDSLLIDAETLHFAGTLVSAMLPDDEGYCRLCYRRLPTLSNALTSGVDAIRSINPQGYRAYCPQHEAKRRDQAGYHYNAENHRARRLYPIFRERLEELLFNGNYTLMATSVRGFLATRAVTPAQAGACFSDFGSRLAERIESAARKASPGAGQAPTPRQVLSEFFRELDPFNPATRAEESGKLDEIELVTDMLRLLAWWSAGGDRKTEKKRAVLNGELRADILRTYRQGITSSRAIAAALGNTVSHQSVAKVIREAFGRDFDG